MGGLTPKTLLPPALLYQSPPLLSSRRICSRCGANQGSVSIAVMYGSWHGSVSFAGNTYALCNLNLDSMWHFCRLPVFIQDLQFHHPASVEARDSRLPVRKAIVGVPRVSQQLMLAG